MIKKISLIVALCTVVLTTISTAYATKYLCIADRGTSSQNFDIFDTMGTAVFIDTELRTVTLFDEGPSVNTNYKKINGWGKPNEVIDEIHTTGSKTPYYVIKRRHGNRKYKVYGNLNYKATTWGGKVYGSCEIKK